MRHASRVAFLKTIVMASAGDMLARVDSLLKRCVETLTSRADGGGGVDARWVETGNEGDLERFDARRGSKRPRD